MGNGAWAFVYHPDNLDPKGYQPLQTASASQSSGTPPVAATATMAATTSGSSPIVDQVKDSGGQNADGTFTTDYRGRLMIGAKFIHGIGLNAGDVVNVISDENTKTVKLVNDSNMPASGNGITVSTLTVSEQFRVYLYNAPIRLAGITESKFKIEQKDAKTVEISA